MRYLMIGSSPRVRGTRPEYASISLYCPVHPRGCGEHPDAPLFAIATTGSSPRVRGTLASGKSSGVQERFIPAGAGNTVLLISPMYLPAVHPRGCGEHNTAASRQRAGTGSSPRVRGTRH